MLQKTSQKLRPKMSDPYNVHWEIVKLEWDEKTGGVVSARWNVVVSDEETVVKAPGTSKFVPNPENDSYIELNNLDEKTVVSWVKDSLLNYEATESRAVERFIRQKSLSTVQSGLPWEEKD
jgi:hypothetical protein